MHREVPSRLSLDAVATAAGHATMTGVATGREYPQPIVMPHREISASSPERRPQLKRLLDFMPVRRVPGLMIRHSSKQISTAGG